MVNRPNWCGGQVEQGEANCGSEEPQNMSYQYVFCHSEVFCFFSLVVMVVLHAGWRVILDVAFVSRLVIAVQVDLQNLIDPLTFGCHGGKQVWRTKHIVEVVMEHVQVVENVGGLGEAVGEGWRDLREQRHETPVERRIDKIAVILSQDRLESRPLLGQGAPDLHFSDLPL